jgi:cytochrome c-type protein NapB
MVPGALALLLAAGCAAGGGGESRVPPGERDLYRRAQRAYDGAPPVVPHAVRALQRQDCLNCHRNGLRLPEALAPRTPHPEWTACLQCHVEQPGRDHGIAANSFEGLRWPARGSRAFRRAPPTIPHPLDSRRNCLGCHGELGGSPIMTPHPDRVNCSQCHVPMRQGVEPWRGSSFKGDS